MPRVAPGAPLNLALPEQHTWMNQIAAEREKGAPLTEAELRRILRGADWRPKWRIKRDTAALELVYPALREGTGSER